MFVKQPLAKSVGVLNSIVIQGRFNIKVYIKAFSYGRNWRFSVIMVIIMSDSLLCLEARLQFSIKEDNH